MKFDEFFKICRQNFKNSAWVQDQYIDDWVQHILRELSELQAEIEGHVYGGHGDVAGELGDLFNVVCLFAVYCENNCGVKLEDSLELFVDKLKCRKPHIFTGEKKTAAEEQIYWNKIKEQEEQAKWDEWKKKTDANLKEKNDS